MKKKKSFGWYSGFIIAGAIWAAFTTCIVSIIVKFILVYLAWIF